MSVLSDLFEDCIRNLSGSLGIRVRRFYYKRRFASFGTGVTIDTGVYFISCSDISIGDNVWIDKNCMLIGGVPGTMHKSVSPSTGKSVQMGKLSIGKNSHIGIGTIIQAHGTVVIGDYFTSSAHCRIYSYSNDYRNSFKGTMPVPEESYEPSYRTGQVEIGKNVWLGLNVSLVSTIVGDDVFVMPHSVVSKPINKNAVAAGNPASFLKKRFE